MSSVTLSNSKFPVGTVVGAYSPFYDRHFEGKPSGTPVETATVASTGKVTFAGLADGNYALWAEVEGKNANVGLLHVPWVEPGTLFQRIKARREEVGAI